MFQGAKYHANPWVFTGLIRIFVCIHNFFTGNLQINWIVEWEVDLEDSLAFKSHVIGKQHVLHDKMGKN